MLTHFMNRYLYKMIRELHYAKDQLTNLRDILIRLMTQFRFDLSEVGDLGHADDALRAQVLSGGHL